MGRPGQPAELASLYVLLASAESKLSTGQVFAAVAVAADLKPVFLRWSTGR